MAILRKRFSGTVHLDFTVHTELDQESICPPVAERLHRALKSFGARDVVVDRMDLDEIETPALTAEQVLEDCRAHVAAATPEQRRELLEYVRRLRGLA